MSEHEKSIAECEGKGGYPECIGLLRSLATNMQVLIGNGNPGRIQKIENIAIQCSDRITRLERWFWMCLGGGAVIGFLLSLLFKK